MKKRIIAITLAISAVVGAVGCTTADTVNYNLLKDANEFNVYRRITVTNARTDTVMLQAEGYMSLSNNSNNELAVTIKTGEDQYYKDTMQRRISITIRENVIIAMSAGRNWIGVM